MLLNWNQTLTQLSQSPSKAARCILRLLDTVFVDENNKLHWYFTTGQSLSLAKKKESSVNIEAIVDRFEKFALANPNNDLEFVAVLVHGNGHYQYMKKKQLSDLLTENMIALQQEGSFLQVFQKPNPQFANTVIVQTIKRDLQTSEVSVTFQLRTVVGSEKGTESALPRSQLSKELLDDLDDFGNEVQRFYRETKQMQVDTLSVWYVVDESNHVWVTRIPSMQISPLPSEPEAVVPSSPAVPATAASLPAVKPPLSRPASGSASMSTTNQDDLWTRPLTASSLANSSSILRKDSTGYTSLWSAEELPGLSAWTVASANTHNDRIVWTLRPQTLTQPLGTVFTDEPNDSPDKERAGLKQLRGRNRQAVPYRKILMIRSLEPLLVGSAESTIPSPQTLQHQWRQAYDAFQAQCAQVSDDQALSYDVLVCGNTLTILKKLESMIASGFDITTAEETRTHSQRAKAATPLMAEDAELTRVASARSHEIVTEEAVDSRRKSEKQKKPKGKKSESVDIYAEKKPKKGEKSSASFSKNSFDAPPSVELIAKFAAEKER